jgi:glutamyl-tRNA synthetase
MQVRFDDTNPTKEKDEYVENIIKDMQTLGLQYKTITYTSDYFPQVWHELQADFCQRIH